MCDTVCSLQSDRTLFAKNSDRPVHEVQLIETFDARVPGGSIATQYLEIDDRGASAVVGSRPAWLWGFEHGVNEHRVAIGNERVFTALDPATVPAALIGMDLVRLGLERARTADDALDVMTGLLGEHGQGGIADQANDEAYFSSFLIADPTAAWVLETSGRSWAAKPAETGAAISNRIALGTDWTHASADVTAGRDFDRWRDPKSWAALADIRLACTVPAVTGAGRVSDAADLAALMRHHGERPWGRPGGDPDHVSELPAERLGPNGEGITVCMHLRNYQATAASMIAELPADPDEPLRAWVASGSPCVGVFIPVFPSTTVPTALGVETTWQRFDTLRERVEKDPAELRTVREVLAPIESELWAEADDISGDPGRYGLFVADAWARVDDGLTRLGV
jgi:secernin